MDLLEYQAKELFREAGIPVLPSQQIRSPKDLRGLRIPYPIALKSQVHIGGRGRVGGIRFAENTIDAIAATQAIFNLPIMGEYPKVLLAEAKYNTEREFYLAVILNRSLRRPVLLGSQEGGDDMQLDLDKIQHVIVDQEFSPYYARRLGLKMGLQGELMATISSIVEKMYDLFIQKDLDLLEINPLGVSVRGEVMALDGKVIVNNAALARHPDLAALASTPENSLSDSSNGDLIKMDPNGQIGILCNGAGLTMATMDLICLAGGTPTCALNIGGETHWDSSPSSLGERLEKGLDLISQVKQVKVLLINLISELAPCNEIAEVIAAYLKRRIRQPCGVSEIRPNTLITHTMRLPHLVVRLVGSQCDRAITLLEANNILVLQDLDTAIAQTISLTEVVNGSS